MTPTVQEALDELFSEHLIPFKLTAQAINSDGCDDFSVPFYDSRFHSVSFHCERGGAIKEIVRSAVLDRMSKMSGPLAA